MKYLLNDLTYTYSLFEFYHPGIKTNFKELYKWELKLIPYLVDMEDAGVEIDIDYCLKVNKEKR